MAWDQQELFCGILSEFADAQAPFHAVEFERAARWEWAYRIANAANAAAWRKRNATHAKQYGDAYRMANRAREVARVRRWKLEQRAKRENARAA